MIGHVLNTEARKDTSLLPEDMVSFERNQRQRLRARLLSEIDDYVEIGGLDDVVQMAYCLQLLTVSFILSYNCILF